MAHRNLSSLIESLIPRYAHQADIRMVDPVKHDALAIARKLVAHDDVDAFLCTGSIGKQMRSSLTVPITSINLSGFDILRALQRAARISQRLALVSYGHANDELEELKTLLSIDIEQFFYETYADADEIVTQLKKGGFKVVVGPSIIVELAEQRNVVGILSHSENSVREALEEALASARQRIADEARRERINTILKYLHEGILAVDGEQKIYLINPTMEHLLGVSAEWALGKVLSEVCPDIDIQHVLRTDAPDLECVQSVRDKTVVVNRIPVKEHGVSTGAVVTFQYATDIERADRNIRKQRRARNRGARYRFQDILGNSEAIRRAVALGENYANNGATVLISGESGSGKELFAQGIHNASARKIQPFIAINCAAFPETLLESELFGYDDGAFTGSRRGGKAGLVELAHHGTLFLDEIGDMPLSLQTRLLRVLQEREVVRLGGIDSLPIDIRVIAATHRNLKNLVAEGKFREDLFYRINILRLDIPPLRERAADIPLLANHLFEAALQRTRSKVHLSRNDWKRLAPLLIAYPWPGNIRELENVMERLAIHASSFKQAGSSIEDLLPHFFAESLGIPENSAVSHLPDALDGRPESDPAAIRETLARFKGNRSKACQALGISRTTLWRKLKSQITTIAKVTPDSKENIP